MAHSFNPNAQPLKVGTFVHYSATGENFGPGCGYVNRIEKINYHEFGDFTYTIKSDVPKSFPFEARAWQVQAIDCNGCKCADECKNRKF